MQTIQLTTDGSCNPMTRIGGWAAILETPDGARREISGSVQDTTNNAMELAAVLGGLIALESPSAVTVVTDSQLVIGWLSQGWKRREPLIRELLEQIEREVQSGCHTLSFQWIKGHAGHAGNTRCDRLAAQAARRPQASGNW